MDGFDFEIRCGVFLKTWRVLEDKETGLGV